MSVPRGAKLKSTLRLWLEKAGPSVRSAALTEAQCMHYDAAVKMLQIRNLPEDLYQALLLRAKREKRSLAQQAVVELGRIAGLDRKKERRTALQAIREETAREGYRRVGPPPEDLIWQDRQR